MAVVSVVAVDNRPWGLAPQGRCLVRSLLLKSRGPSRWCPFVVVRRAFVAGCCEELSQLFIARLVRDYRDASPALGGFAFDAHQRVWAGHLSHQEHRPSGCVDRRYGKQPALGLVDDEYRIIDFGQTVRGQLKIAMPPGLDIHQADSGRGRRTSPLRNRANEPQPSCFTGPPKKSLPIRWPV